MTGSPAGDASTDRALRVTLPESFAEVAGAVLMELLGPFEHESESAATGVSGGDAADPSASLVFYPAIDAMPAAEDLLALLPAELAGSGRVRVETRDVSREWVEGWRDHFRPIVVGGVRIRPPWEPGPSGPGASAGAPPNASAPGSVAPDVSALLDVVINPGLGFGTGLHPTTRGTLQLLQLAHARRAPRRRGTGTRGRLVDAGTGSGILAIAAAKLGWGPVVAFDNDPVALVSTRENVEANAVEGAVDVHEVDLAGAAAEWFAGATVLANMTLEPVLSLVRRLGNSTPPLGAKRPNAADPAAGGRRNAAVDATAGPAAGLPLRLVVSGILAGGQEYELLRVARECGFVSGQRLYEAEWVSLELLPVVRGATPARAGAG